MEPETRPEDERLIWKRPRICLSWMEYHFIKHRAAELGVSMDAYIGGMVIVACDDAMDAARRRGEQDWRDDASRADLTGVQQ